MSVSQPSLGSPLQSANPSAHVGTHSPFSQRVEPLSFEHTASHAPQCSASSTRSCSHPVSTSASQSPNPSAHAMAQPRLVHDGSPFTSLHTFPHILQLSTAF